LPQALPQAWTNTDTDTEIDTGTEIDTDIETIDASASIGDSIKVMPRKQHTKDTILNIHVTAEFSPVYVL